MQDLRVPLRIGRLSTHAPCLSVTMPARLSRWPDMVLENLNDVLKEHDASADLARYIVLVIRQVEPCQPRADASSSHLESRDRRFRHRRLPGALVQEQLHTERRDHNANYHKQRTDEEILAFLRDRDPSRAETMSPCGLGAGANMDLETLRRFWGVRTTCHLKPTTFAWTPSSSSSAPGDPSTTSTSAETSSSQMMRTWHMRSTFPRIIR